MFWFVLIAAIILFVIFIRHYKPIRTGDIELTTGGVKTGKTSLSVSRVRKEINKRHFKWTISKHVCKLFHKPIPEEPRLYSNIPIKHKLYTPLTTDILERKKRFNFKSVLYVCEASLVADSMTFNDKDLNERLLYFNKLISHEGHGSKLFYDTQNLLDNHYNIKRCLNSFIYIHHCIKWVPFILILKVKEMQNFSDTPKEDNTDDPENNLKTIIISKRIWRIFDCYCYSSLTDNLPREDVRPVKMYNGSLKANEVITFKKGGNL